MAILIQFVLPIIILTIIYVRMTKREVPSIGKAQSLVPIFFGILSLIFSVALSIGLSILLIKLGYNKNNVDSIALKSIVGSFVAAGLPEEIGKFLFIILSIKIFKPKNVYEYVLIGFGVGMGFTLFEESLNGLSIASILRIFVITFHSVLASIMASYIGKAKYYKTHNVENKNIALEYVKALIIPIIIHTLYDATNVKNAGLEAGVDENTQGIAIYIALFTILIAFILQIVILIKIKKDTDKLNDMKV